MIVERSDFFGDFVIFNEGELISHSLVLDTDTTGKTLTALIIGKTLGTADGDSEDTEISISLDTDELLPGEYDYEVWVDHELSTQEMVFPEKSKTFKLKVIDRIGV